jgi:hypothetical protein
MTTQLEAALRMLDQSFFVSRCLIEEAQSDMNLGACVMHFETQQVAFSTVPIQIIGRSRRRSSTVVFIEVLLLPQASVSGVLDSGHDLLWLSHRQSCQSNRRLPSPFPSLWPSAAAAFSGRLDLSLLNVRITSRDKARGGCIALDVWS